MARHIQLNQSRIGWREISDKIGCFSLVGIVVPVELQLVFMLITVAEGGGLQGEDREK